MRAMGREALASMGLLLLRVGMGVLLMTHGWGKVVKVAKGEFGAFADPIGIGTGASLVLAAGAEFVCALLVVVGLATRLAAVPVVFTMGVATFVVHGSDPWTMGEGARLYKEGLAGSWSSKEPALLFLVGFLALALTGGGRYSLDALLRRREARPGPESKG